MRTTVAIGVCILFVATMPARAQEAEPAPAPSGQDPARQTRNDPGAAEPTESVEPAEAKPATPVPTGRVSENAVTAAEDAFGTSIGRETIGLYSAGSVRGFSAIAAGNARIESLYFDPVWTPNARIRRSTTIRVGLAAQGFAFPAPTGIIDYALKKPGADASLSTFASIDSYESVALEVDGVLPISSTLSVGGGVGLYRNSFYNATVGLQHVEGLSLRWQPSPGLEVQPFWARSDIYDDEFGPIYVPDGAFLPPDPPRRRFDGPEQPKYRSTATLYGTLARYAPGRDWLVRLGLFRTFFDDERTATNLLLGLKRDGSARQLFIVDPPSRLASTSGELRITRSFTDGPRLHVIHASARGRHRRDRYDGSDSIDLGPTAIGRPVAPLGPDFTFTEQSLDRVRQWTGGVAYEGRWKDVGEVSFGIQKTDYTKRIAQPGLPVAESKATPFLFNVAGAVNLSDTLVAYAGYTRGLEESGVAPENAANRNEALPAIRTSQRDAGLRWAIRPDLKLIAGLFDVRKPYFNLDEANVFTLLGDVKHQGIEASLAGKLTPRLDIVAGAVLLRARVTGEGVELGRVGRRPVGQAARNLQLNLDWRPPALDGLSLDLGVTHLSNRAARRDNLVALPARTLVDVGGRYRFKLDRHDASLRVRVSNLFNVYGFDLRGSGAYDLIAGRVVSASLAIDF